MRVITMTFGVLAIGIVLCASLFTGMMIATAGGAIHPPLYRAGASLACEGELVIESRAYSYKPGQSGVQHTLFCEQPRTGVREEITFRAIFMAFLVYSACAFVVFALLAVPLLWWLRRKFDAFPQLLRRAQVSMQDGGIVPGVRIVHRHPRHGVTAENDETSAIAGRLRQLARLRDEGLVSEQEYAAKKAEILAGL